MKLNGGPTLGGSDVTATTKGSPCGGGHFQRTRSPAIWGIITSPLCSWGRPVSLGWYYVGQWAWVGADISDFNSWFM